MNLMDQLTSILNDLQGLWVETTLIFGSILILLVGLFRSSSIITKLIFAGSLLIAVRLNISNESVGVLLIDSINITKPSIYFGSLFLMVALLILLFQRSNKHATEFYFFIMAMLVGSMLMMKADSLLIIYLTIELVSFSSYILTNFTFKKQSFEAGIKYLLFGAISSAIMLFGLGLIYGGTGIFSITGLGEISSINLITTVGVGLMLVGVLFKISIVPAHIWVPATYQSAPVDAAAFMSIVPKLAGLVLIQRVFALNVISNSGWIIETVWLLGILTIITGTLGAFRQLNARRMISFGAIAHSGFLLPFTIINSSTSHEAFWWYAIAYAIMNLGVFYMLDQYERRNVFTLPEYKTAGRAVWMGAGFTLILISLVGLPPVAGFMAKLFLFSTLWEFYLSSDSIVVLWYLIVAVLATVGSLFYYLQIPRHIFLSKDAPDQSIKFSLLAKIIATLFTIGLLLLFFVPKLVIVMQQLLNNVNE